MPDGPDDTSDESSTSESVADETTDTPDGSVTGDESHTTDDSDATDSTPAPDDSDTADSTPAPDDSDTADHSDATDESNAADGSDVPGESDTADESDATDDSDAADESAAGGVPETYANGDGPPGGRTVEGPLGPNEEDDEASNGASGGLTKVDREPTGGDAGTNGTTPADAADGTETGDPADEAGDGDTAATDADAGDEAQTVTADDVMENVPDGVAEWSEDEYAMDTPGESATAGESDATDESNATGEPDTTDESADYSDVIPTKPDDAALNENPGPGGDHTVESDGGEASPPAEATAAPAAGAETAGAEAGVAGSIGSGTGVDTDEEVLDGPESDEEMPLTDHIEEMMRRLSVVVAVGSVVTFGVLAAGIGISFFPSAEDIIVFLWDHHVNFDSYRPYVYGPLEFLLTKLKVAGLAGVVVSLPVFVYQTYRFMRPGLYPHERRYYLAAVPTSLVLAVVGVAFAHFVVLPAIFQYFIGYTEASAQLAFGLRETFNLILLMMGYMAVVFQIPLFIQLAIMMGLVTRRWLENRRLIFWGSFLGLSFLVSPDPTGMAPIIVTATMIALFEGTLALLRWTGN